MPAATDDRAPSSAADTNTIIPICMQTGSALFAKNVFRGRLYLDWINDRDGAIRRLPHHRTHPGSRLCFFDKHVWDGIASAGNDYAVLDTLDMHRGEYLCEHPIPKKSETLHEIARHAPPPQVLPIVYTRGDNGHIEALVVYEIHRGTLRLPRNTVALCNTVSKTICTPGRDNGVTRHVRGFDQSQLQLILEELRSVSSVIGYNEYHEFCAMYMGGHGGENVCPQLRAAVATVAVPRRLLRRRRSEEVQRHAAETQAERGRPAACRRDAP